MTKLRAVCPSDSWLAKAINPEGETIAGLLADIAVMRGVLDAMKEDNARLKSMLKAKLLTTADTQSETLQEKVEAVIKGVVGGQVPAKQVDALHEATGRSRTDRSVGRAIGQTGSRIGLVVTCPA
jgi:hypothetical protein